MREAKETRIDLQIGDGAVTIRRSGSSRVAVASVLGRETNPGTGKQTIWLDRAVHRHEETMYVGNQIWRASGAISTVLTEM